MSTSSGEARGVVSAPAWDGDPDPRVPWRVDGLLAPFVAAGALVSADVHVARRLGAIGGEPDERVHLAVALAVASVRSGSVCVDLTSAPAAVAADLGDRDPDVGADLPWPALDGADGWRAAVRRSPLVADGPHGPDDRPVRLVDDRVYLDRYWRDELAVRREVEARVRATLPVDLSSLDDVVRRLFPDDADEQQREAVRVASGSLLTVLTGGPGTGKTTTVARLVAALQVVAGPDLRVALAAPTGKAASRLHESVNAEVAGLPDADRDRVGTLAASTLHRLLGRRPGSSTRFRHDRTRRLPYDVVVVDESSMVSLPLMARLVEALRPEARLVLVGDPDQLASVEAGAVLGDLVEALHGRAVVRLTRTHRFGHELGGLAAAIREGDADRTLALLRAGGTHVHLTETAGDVASPHELAGLRRDLEDAGAALVAAARDGDATGALRALGRHRLLLAHREGPAGVAHWAAQAEAWVEGVTGGRPDDGPWPPGRPLLVTENDATSGLSNGDTGVVVRDLGGEGSDESDAAVVVAFGDAERPHLVRPHRLPAVQTVHAMTVHRGQGSQFTRVTVLLPPATSPLLTRELLYTAVTRARDSVHVIGSEAAVRAAVERPVRRASGLRHAL
ncbi:exodeoxyribonuclease V subunit alpha [Cellulomonas algicola]|uniref:RecBCD enzyme subunit RecD n=1 Tax=Cellulomonas algicola TaxID=2071633 RepID=A0A401UVT7_9CELL|nr:exodeoxyribonuclease V subunit alpha [Cellulomonas algicola]GCD18801.1 RecBCD enzyme subunit RecD [Cellulomonas algicola]